MIRDYLSNQFCTNHATRSTDHESRITQMEQIMAIEFKTPEAIEKQLVPVRTVAENVMRPESRYLDDNEHARPVKFVQIDRKSVV